MWTDNAVRDAERYYNDLDERLERRPVCDFCGEHIQEETYYCISHRLINVNICERCLEEFREYVE